MRGELNIIIHATEDMDRILTAVKNMFDIDLARKNMKRRDLSGHYGNPIIYLTIKLSSSDVKNILYKMREKLSVEERNYFLNTIDEYFHRSTVYIRLDKQRLCQGKLSLVEEDPIKIVIRNVNPNLIEKWLTGDED